MWKVDTWRSYYLWSGQEIVDAQEVEIAIERNGSAQLYQDGRE